MSYDPEGAIKVLQDGLAPGMPHTFAQADALVSSSHLYLICARESRVLCTETTTQLLFELAWTFLSQRRYQEAADTFMKITELNSWYVDIGMWWYAIGVLTCCVGAMPHMHSSQLAAMSR